MAEHTPTPWQYHEWGIASGRRFGIETADRKHGLASIEPNVNASTGLSMDEHHANAAFIVRACNAHDELLAIAYGLVCGVKTHQRIGRTLESCIGSVFEVASAAIERIQQADPEGYASAIQSFMTQIAKASGKETA